MENRFIFILINVILIRDYDNFDLYWNFWGYIGVNFGLLIVMNKLYECIVSVNGRIVILIFISW